MTAGQEDSVLLWRRYMAIPEGKEERKVEMRYQGVTSEGQGGE